MKLTKAGEYAVRAILYLASCDREVVVRKAEIAEAMAIPPHFLSKIAQMLARAGLLIIKQGASGGYRLPRPPEKISLLSVIEAVEGQIVLNDCLTDHQFCGRSERCAVHNVWVTVREVIRSTLADVNFAELAALEGGPTTGWGRSRGRLFPLSECLGAALPNPGDDPA